MKTKKKHMKKVVLAYSGGLDTSVILKWIKETYQCEVATFTADLGQDEDFDAIKKKAEAQNVTEIFIEDIKDNLQAIIISHGHEDHAGAVAYLADKIDCPVYASSFPKLLIENRLKEFGKQNSIELIEFDSTKNILLDKFNLRFVGPNILIV